MPPPSDNNPMPNDAPEAGLPMALPDVEPLPTVAAAGALSPASAAASAAARAKAPRRRLDALRGLLFGPIFLRDLRVASRSRSTYMTRAAIVLILLTVLVIAYTAVFSTSFDLSNAARFQRLQVIAPSLTLTMVWFYFLVFPMLAASGIGGIAGEHARGTLSAMASTPMSPASIVLSTFAARLVQVALLFGLTLPAIIIISGYGGIELSALLSAAAITLSTIILAGSLASLGAVIGKKPGSGAATGIGLLVLMNAYPLILAALAATLGLPRAMWWQHTLYGSPFVAMLATPGLVGGISPVGIPVLWFLFAHICVSLAVSAGALALSFSLWRSNMRRAMAGAPVLTRKAKRAARKLAAAQAAQAAAGVAVPDAAVGGDAVPAALGPVIAPRLASGSRTVGDRPVLWREMQHLRPFASIKSTIVTALPLLGLALMYYNERPSDPSLLMVATIMATLFSVLIGCASASSSLSDEIHRRTLPLLLTSRQKVRQMLWEKFFAAWLRPWPLAFALAVHCVIGAIFGGAGVIVALPLLLVLAAGTAMTTSASLLGAVLMRKASGATGFAVLIGAAFWVLPWIIFGVIQLLLAFNGPSQMPGVVDVLLMLNPVGLNGNTAETFGRFSRGDVGASLAVHMPTIGSIALPLWLLINLGFAALAFVWTRICLEIAEKRFDRSVLPRLV